MDSVGDAESKIVPRSGSWCASETAADRGMRVKVEPTMPQKTNAARFLDQMGIRYELREYEVDPNDLAAEAVAAKIGLPREQLSKHLLHKAIGTVSAWRSFQPIRNWTLRRLPQSPVITKFIWCP